MLWSETVKWPDFRYSNRPVEVSANFVPQGSTGVPQQGQHSLTQLAESCPLNVNRSPMFLPASWVTCELTVVVGACRVLLVGAEWGAGRGACAEAGVTQGWAHFARLTAVVDWPLDVQGRRKRGTLLGLETTQEEENCLRDEHFYTFLLKQLIFENFVFL